MKNNFIFFGNANISKKIIDNLIKNNIYPTAIFSETKKKFNSDYVDLSNTNLSLKHKYKTSDINSKKNINIIKKLKPDFILCIGMNTIIKKELLQIPRYGCIGFHPTDLPHNRGNSPVIWTIILGLKKSYCTFFRMDEKIDNGTILLKKSIKVHKHYTSTSLYNKIVKTTKNEILKFIFLEKYKKRLKEKVYKHKLKSKKTNIWRKRNFNDGIINWKMRAIDIYRLNLVYKVLILRVFKYKNFLFS